MADVFLYIILCSVIKGVASVGVVQALLKPAGLKSAEKENWRNRHQRVNIIRTFINKR